MDETETYAELWGQERWGDLLPLLQARVEAARKNHDPAREAAALSELGFLFDEVGDPSKALRTIRAELHLRRRLENPEELAQTLDVLAWRMLEAGHLSSAIRCQRAALTIYIHLQKVEEIFLAMVNLADLLWRQERLAEATHLFQAALPMAPKNYPAWGNARIQESLSLLAERMGNLQEATRHQFQFLHELYAQGQDFSAADGLARLARLHALQGQTWEAHELFAEGAHSLERHGESEKAEQVRTLGRAWTQKRSWRARAMPLSLRGRCH